MQKSDDRPTIYVSSKRTHTQLWRMYKYRGYRIISSWIDLEGAIDVETIGNVYWPTWLQEAASAAFLIFYAHPQDVDHSANLLEIGTCLSAGGTILHVGVSENMKTKLGDRSDFTYHPRWHRVADLDVAFKLTANQLDPLVP